MNRPYIDMNNAWTEEQVAAYLARFRDPAVSAADMESNLKHGSKTTNVGEKVYSRVRINVHSKRRRLCDPDGVSAKAAIDGLVKGGLLTDDSAKYIDAVTFSQEHSENEETVIELWKIE